MSLIIDNAATLRGQFKHDPHRPRYHFLAPANWMNDPNGVTFYAGQYHLFYQYNPTAPTWGNIHWGHAVSDDLIHWQDWPIALSPTPDSADEHGCWSGTFLDNGGIPTLLYTGVRGDIAQIENQRPCIATSTDGMVTWQKFDSNPVIANSPQALTVLGFRDHCVWREADEWYQIIGSGIAGQGGAVLLYRSSDLYRWEYVHPLCVGSNTDSTDLWLGTVWECPQFFPFGDKYMLAMSIWHEGQGFYTTYMLGSYRDQRFFPESVHKLDYGDTYYYAPQSLLDYQQRRIMWGWIQEGRSVADQEQAGWSGVMALPRVISATGDDVLLVAPAPELQALRREHRSLLDLSVNQSTEIVSAQFEILLEVTLNPASACSLLINHSLDNTEFTRISFDTVQSIIVIDNVWQMGSKIERKEGALRLEANEHLRLHMFFDHSVVEVFANSRVVITSRIYPQLNAAKTISVTAAGEVSIVSFDLWELDSIWD